MGTHFTEYVAELKKKEKEEKDEKRKAAKKGFKELLKDTDSIDRHAHWSDFKKHLADDPRYQAVGKSADREDWFLDYVQELKDEHRREKDRKKAERSRSRSSSRGRKTKTEVVVEAEVAKSQRRKRRTRTGVGAK